MVYMYVNMMNILRKLDSNVIKIFREVIKKKQVFRGHVPYQEGGRPPTFFRQNVKKIQYALKNLFYSNNFSVFSPLSEYRFYRNIYKKYIVFPLKGLRVGLGGFNVINTK